MFGKKRKKDLISKEQAENIFSLGEKLSQKLKLPERIKAINKYGNEKPQMAFFYIFVLIFFSFILGFLYPKPKYDTDPVINLNNESPPENHEIEFKNEVLKIYSEIQQLTDTIEFVMSKSVLTKEDTILLNEKFLRLEHLDKVLNGGFDNK